MPVEHDLRRAPPRDRLALLCAQLVPGGRLGRIRPLAGGISSGMHAFDVVAPSGERSRFVLRRYGDYRVRHDAGVGRREWHLLTALAHSPVAAPQPVLLDVDGELFGRPTLVTSRLPGHGLLRPDDVDGWIQQLADALAAIHHVPVAGLEMAGLENWDASRGERLRGDPPTMGLARAGAAEAVWSTLRARWPRVEPGLAVLLHGDYWAGNTLWARGRLTGVVDWEEAGLGGPGNDVGYCHLDLALCVGRELADRFVRAYESSTRAAVPDLAFWDLLAAWRALPDPSTWLPGWHAFGLPELTAATVRARLAEFIDDALDRCRS